MQPSEKWLQDLSDLVQARNQESAVLRAEKGELESVLTKIVAAILTASPEDVKPDADVGDTVVRLVHEVVALRKRVGKLEDGLKLAKEVIRVSGDKKHQAVEWEEWSKKLEEAVKLFGELLANEEVPS